MSDEHRDELPADLDVSGYVGQYTFPDIRRRRIPGIIYLTLAVGCLALWATHRGDDRVLVNHGTLVAGVALLLIGCYHVATAWPLAVRDPDERALADRYNDQDPVRVLDGLTAAADRLAVVLRDVDAGDWGRLGDFPWGSRDMLTMARNAVHEGAHHLRDVDRVLRAVVGHPPPPA